MIPLTLAQIAAVTGGTLHDVPDREAVVTGPLAFDSRRPMPGSLFLALNGARDGHEFAGDALKAGAVAVLAARPVGVPAVVVPDVLAAAADLTRHLAGSLHAHVIGLTGSSGKTSTKDLLAQVLPALGPTVATEQSFNNEFGVPVTVSRATADTEFLVLEMGARGIGHIRYLTRMAPLDTGIVLNIGSAHLGEFGSREQTAQAKSELLENLPATGFAVLNADDPLVTAMAARTAATVIRFGIHPGADVRAERVTLDGDGHATFTLRTPEGSAETHLRLAGGHHVANALAVAAAVLPHKMAPDAIAEALGDAEPVSAGRMEITDRPDGVRVVNDAYNANPESMRAALDALAVMTANGRRPVAVLGAMLELGDHSPQAHRLVGEQAAAVGAHVIAVGGREAQWIAQGAGADTVVGTRDEALDLLQAFVRPGDVVLFKSSRDSELRLLAASFAAREGLTEPA